MRKFDNFKKNKIFSRSLDNIQVENYVADRDVYDPDLIQ
jgi:hypothetical protein